MRGQNFYEIMRPHIGMQSGYPGYFGSFLLSLTQPIFINTKMVFSSSYHQNLKAFEPLYLIAFQPEKHKHLNLK
jgi:hypothetical protein